MSTLKSTKASLRNEIKNILKILNDNERKRQSEVIFKKLISLSEYKISKRISLYLSTPEEVDTIDILKDAFKKGKEVFVPRYNNKKMEMVKIYSMDDYNELPLTKWNIKQPCLKENRDNALKDGGLDLIILPGLAFTTNGKRLGHGMGYYDRYLESVAIHQKKMPYLIALAFNEQVMEDIPTNEKDVAFNMILTEKDHQNS